MYRFHIICLSRGLAALSSRLAAVRLAGVSAKDDMSAVRGQMINKFVYPKSLLSGICRGITYGNDSILNDIPWYNP